jgi:hypothetical protein
LWFLFFLSKPLLERDGFAQEEAMNRTMRCAHCRCLFVPNPRATTQRFCANKACQRARKAQWQRAKMATDPDDRANQQDCQHRWQHEHPQYWRQYRQHRADSRERNRLLQQHRDYQRRLRPLAKMDGFAPVTGIQPFPAKAYAIENK